MRKEKEVELPDWLDPQVWFDYLDHRKVLRKPMSKRAKELAIMKLDKMRQSEDPRFIVDRSIENGWSGFWPKKEIVETSLQREADVKGLTPRPGETQQQWEQRVRNTR